jgi:lysozyme
MHSFYLDAIRTFEGYAPKAAWDYAQLSNGYGTKARFAGEVIDPAEAERRFRTEVANARAVVDKAAPLADEGTKAALTSLTYNAGTAWVDGGLGDAVRRGDLETARDIFQKYTKAGGEVLPGLVSRRAQEALWIGNPEAVGAASPGSSVADASGADGAALPPVVVADAAADVASAAAAAASASRGSTETFPVSFARGPKVERVGHDSSTVTLASDTLAAIAGLDRLADGNAADIARLANLKRGSELARPGQDRDRERRDTARV